MEISTSLSLLMLLLLGLSQANPIHIDGENTDEHLHMSAGGILTTNNQSSQLLLEGDLILPKHRNAMRCFQGDSCKWKKSSNGQVGIAYTIGSEYSPQERQIIENALRSFASVSCIRFVPRTTETDYIMVASQDGCFSALGRQRGPQVLSINKRGCMENKIIQHETLHALGFQHEHTRSDRDQYVKINFANIDPGQYYNFAKSDTNNLGTSYDYSSIMQYPRRGFAINPNIDVIIPIPNPNVAIGQSTTFSRTDIERINRLYQC
ncbi:high choriolytic enzyme 1-like [Osmerus mordax]|uniref:high choriolytic enzyme 1-like n=1 Tax=Osmerus mordax TaxID=8014 RepID=UPI00350ECE62